jgi:hypothetical protein
VAWDVELQRVHGMFLALAPVQFAQNFWNLATISIPFVIQTQGCAALRTMSVACRITTVGLVMQIMSAKISVFSKNVRAKVAKQQLAKETNIAKMV